MAFQGLRVDNYTSADYIDVYCDGFRLRFSKLNSAGANHVELQSTSGTKWSDTDDRFYVSANDYYFGWDDKRTYEIIENTPARVRIRIVGNFDRTTGVTDDYLANSTSIVYVYTIYPDRYSVDWTWEVSGAITVSWGRICCLDGAIANLTNENNICESSGSEISCVDATSYDSADYIGWTSDEVNYFVIKLHDSDGTVGQYSDSDGSVLLGDGPEPTGAAIYTFSAVYIVDSAARVDGKQYDSSALRLALGDQFKDVSLTTNDFTNDPNCVALYKFEDTPGFVADSIRDNDLTNNGPEEENTVVFEGAQSAKFIRVNSDQFYISDADLDDDFPMKNGGTGKTYTICGRVYLNSITATHYIMSKYVGAGPFSLSFDSSGYLRLWHQTGGYKPFGTVCQTGRWYSFAVSYNDTDYSYRIRIYDHTANDFLGPDATGDMGGTPTLTTAQLAWGGRADNQDYLDGYLDEIVVFNRWLESYELDTIREKNFSPPLVIDLNYPGNIAGSALASDGAWHTEPDDPTGKPHVDNDDLKEGITEAGQLGEGLVGCWLFNERSGTAINSLTDTDYDGTIVDENSDGYPAWCPEGIKNVSSTSYDRYINIAANPVTPAAFTVITKAIFRNDGHHKLISRHDGTEGFYGWTLTRIGTDDKLRLNFSSDGTAWYQSCETPINACPIDEWATWAATYESGAQKIYKNGNMIESDTQSGAIYNHANQKFMLLYSDYEKENNIEEEAFYGRMEFMFFWNRVLTTDEVMFVTNNPYWVFEQALRMEIAWDRTRHKPNVVVHDLPFVSGTTPDDHLISHLKLDENASSPCLHSQKATNVNDDFTGTNGDAPRSDLWDETDTSNVMDIQNNKLNYAYTGTEQVEGTAYTKYYFEGDFDIQVDFDITTFEASSVNDNRLCLNVRDIDETVWSRIARIVEPDSEQRYEVSGPVTSDTNYLNSATSGKFRVTRVGGTVKGYVWENGRWEWNGSTDGFTFSEDWTDLVVKIALYGLHAASAGSSTMDVNWDNVIINSGASASAFWRELSDGSFRDTNSSGDSVEGVRGNALDTQDTIAYIDASLAGHRNAFFKKGSVFIKFKPVFGFDDGAYQQVWKLWVDDNNLISLWYDYINDRFTARCRIGGANYDVDTPVYTSDNDLQQWHTAHIAWDLDNDFHILILDGKPLGTSIPTNAPPTGDPVIFTFGADDGRGDPAEIYMDEIKTFNDCILPYGSVFVGNGEIDTDLADPDVCFHWDCENSGANASNIPADKTITLNGSAVLATTDPIYGAKHLDTVVDDDDASIPVVSYDILDPRHGSISFWVNLQSAVVNDHILGFGDANNFIALVLDGSGPFRFIYNANSVSIDCTGTVNAIAGKWYHVRLAFSDSNNDGEISLHINGVLLESAAISNAWGYGGTGTLYLGSSYLSWSGQDCFIDQITIAKNPHTPQNWTAFGKPLWRPILQVS